MMKSSILVLGTAVVALVAAKAVRSDGSASTPATSNEVRTSASVTASAEVELQRIEGGHGMLAQPFGLCEIAKRHGGEAGLYRVDRLLSKLEKDSRSKDHAYTYIDLTLIEAWSIGAPRQPVVRITGGAYPDGSVGGYLVSLNAGETAGLILNRTSEKNKGYYGLGPLGVFRTKGDGGFTNEYHLTKQKPSAAELGDVMRGVLANRAGGCKSPDVPVDADDVEHRSVVAQPDQIPGGTVVLKDEAEQ